MTFVSRSFHLLLQCLMLLLLGSPASAADTVPALPEPLSLAHALSLFDEPHPGLVRFKALREQGQARQRQALANDDVEVSVDSRLAWVEPRQNNADQGHDDFRASLTVRKQLYDFGRQSAGEQAAELEQQASELRYQSERQQRVIDIMQTYFDVMLADLQYVRDNEAMSIAFIRMDDTQDQFELGRVSEVDVLERESHYQQSLSARTRSSLDQRAFRAELANTLNRPGQLPDNLAVPSLPGNQRALPEFETVEAQVIDSNPAIASLQQRVAASAERLREARAGNRPVLDAEVVATTRSRTSSSAHPLQAGLVLSVPLFTGDRVRANSALRVAEQSEAAAELGEMTLALRQRVLEVWLDIQSLRQQLEERRRTRDYRELELDRQRTLYELESEANLGNSMVNVSEANLRLAETRYQLAISWAELDALTGASPEQIIQRTLGTEVTEP